MIYILIIMTWFGGTVSGYAVTTQQFVGQDACAAAEQSVRDHWDGSKGSLKVWCVPGVSTK